MTDLITAIVLITAIIVFWPKVLPTRKIMGCALPQKPVDPTRVAQAATYLKKTNVTGAVLNQGENEVFQYGNVDHISNIYSCRKSVISVLYGIAEAKGMVNLEKNLGEIDIDEKRTPLTDLEKSATIRNLLMARSGVYLPSGAETQWMKENRPKRGAFKPGENFYYNNWDFNVLGTIFEKETGIRIGQAFYDWIALPTEMEDFLPRHVHYAKESHSEHKTWRFYMSTRDMGRFGTLIAHDGRWHEAQIVPKEWIELSMTPHTLNRPPEDEGEHYGYLWWLDLENGLEMAVGYHGQYIVIDRMRKLSFAVKVHSGINLWGELMAMLKKVDIETEEVLEALEILKRDPGI